MHPHCFVDVLPAEDYEKLLNLIERGARELRGRVIWNVRSTAKGGGVVELLRPLLGCSRGGGVDRTLGRGNPWPPRPMNA